MKIDFRNSSIMWFRVSSCSTGFSYPPISNDGVELTVTKKHKYLGLIFDCSFCLDLIVLPLCVLRCHITYICLVLIAMHVIDYSLMKMLLESLVLSCLLYCVAVCGPSLGSTLLQRLQRMQNHAVRLCCNLQKHA